MFDPITLAVGGAVFAAGWVAGRLRRPSPPLAVEAPETCGCGHPLALHDRGANQCHGQGRREYYHANGSRNGYEWVDCTCRRYIGPLPVDEILGLPGVATIDRSA